MDKYSSFAPLKMPFYDYGPKMYCKRIRFDRPGLLSISSKPIDDQWEFFVKSVEEFQPLNKKYIETSNKFYVLHNHLINLLANNNPKHSHLLDKTQFQAFENI